MQRNEIASIPDGLGGTSDVPVVNIYPENRHDTRFRQVFVQTINGMNIKNPVNPNPGGTNYSADYRGTWAIVPGYDNIVGNDLQVTYTAPSTESHQFYRLRVWLEP